LIDALRATGTRSHNITIEKVEGACASTWRSETSDDAEHKDSEFWPEGVLRPRGNIHRRQFEWIRNFQKVRPKSHGKADPYNTGTGNFEFGSVEMALGMPGCKQLFSTGSGLLRMWGEGAARLRTP
jgi:hypothetical protein